MNKQKLYWLCQTAGWLILLFVDFSLKAVANIFVTEQIIAVLFLYGSGLFVSHYLRKVYHLQLVNTSLPKMIFKIIVFSFLAANAVMLICLPVLILAKSIFTDITLPVSFILYFSNTFWMSVVFLIWSTLYFFITRTRENKRLKIDQADMALNLKEAQLVTLQQQLNPHFIFNCINNIRALILEEPDKARNMLAHMAEMLRYNLDSDQKAFIRIADEVAVAHDYIALCSIQFEQRLNYKEAIDEECLDELIPKMTIQLLLENAVKHGINNSIDGGLICLSISHLDNDVLIQVENTGQLDNHSASENIGIGIKNIESRLIMAYSDKASFSIKQIDDLVVAQIRLPREV